jgi:hypothetical protein
MRLNGKNKKQTEMSKKEQYKAIFPVLPGDSERLS